MNAPTAFSTAALLCRRPGFRKPLEMSESISVSCNKTWTLRRPLRRRIRYRRMRSAAEGEEAFKMAFIVVDIHRCSVTHKETRPDHQGSAQAASNEAVNAR